MTSLSYQFLRLPSSHLHPCLYFNDKHWYDYNRCHVLTADHNVQMHVGVIVFQVDLHKYNVIVPLSTSFTAKVISMKNSNPCHPHCILILYGVGYRNYRSKNGVKISGILRLLYIWWSHQPRDNLGMTLFVIILYHRIWQLKNMLFAILCNWICTFKGSWW